MRPWRPAAVAALLLATGCSGAQTPLDPAGDQAAFTADVWRMMLWVCGSFYVAVLALLLWAVLRRRRGEAAEPIANSYDSVADSAMRTGLTTWTALVVVALVGLAAGSFLVDRRLAQASTAEALHVKVTGEQWWWKVEYDDPVARNRITTANELHLPTGRPVVLEMVSDDVIHSFWMPNLAGKIDLIPGRTNYLTITPRRAGVYRGQCAEFCGLEHTLMAFEATVESPARFAAWRARQIAPPPPPAGALEQRGLQVFTGGACNACHQIGGTTANGKTGPDLTHFGSRPTLAAGALPNTPENLSAWLKDPQAIKPGAKMPAVPMSDDDRRALVAYLGSLK